MNRIRDPNAAAEMAVNAVLRYLRESGITGQNEQQEWIARVFEAVRLRNRQVN